MHIPADTRSPIPVISVQSVGDCKTIETTINKYNFYAFLKEQELKVPKFHVIKKASELTEACEAVSYPKYPVCVKATELSGSRGIRMIDPSKSRFDILFGEKPNSFFTSFEDLQATLQKICQRDRSVASA